MGNETLNKSIKRQSMLIIESEDRTQNMDHENERHMQQLKKEWEQRLNEENRKHMKERRSLVQQATNEKEGFLKKIDELEEDKEEMSLQIQLLNTDNESLNKEQRRLYDEVHEYKNQVESLQNDLDCLLTAHGNENDPINTSQEEKFAQIIKDYELQVRNLRDNNDELRVELENLSSRKNRRSNETNVRSSNNGNLPKNPPEALNLSPGVRNKVSDLESTICQLQNEKNELEIKHRGEISQLKHQLDKTDNRKIEEQHKTISSLNEENKNLTKQCESLE